MASINVSAKLKISVASRLDLILDKNSPIGKKIEPNFATENAVSETEKKILVGDPRIANLIFDYYVFSIHLQLLFQALLESWFDQSGS